MFSISSSVKGCFGFKFFRKWCDLFFSFLRFQISQWLAWGGATIIGLIAIMSSSLSETSEPLQPRSDSLLAFLKLLWLARGGRCVCLLITDWPKGCLHHLQGMKCLFWRTHKHASQPQNIYTVLLTHTDALSFFFSLDFYPSLCRTNTWLKITLFLTLPLSHTHTLSRPTHTHTNWHTQLSWVAMWDSSLGIDNWFTLSGTWIFIACVCVYQIAGDGCWLNSSCRFSVNCMCTSLHFCMFITCKGTSRDVCVRVCLYLYVRESDSQVISSERAQTSLCLFPWHLISLRNHGSAVLGKSYIGQS